MRASAYRNIEGLLPSGPSAFRSDWVAECPAERDGEVDEARLPRRAELHGELLAVGVDEPDDHAATGAPASWSQPGMLSRWSHDGHSR